MQSHSNEAEGGLQQAANELERQLTRQIRDSAAIEELEQIVCERGSSFSFIHTTAALTRFAKLGRSGQGDSGLLQQLVHKWLQQLPEAGVRECFNVLWACANSSNGLVAEVWGPTWAAFMQHVQQGSGKGLVLHDISSAVQAAPQLRKQLGANELQLLVQAFLQPDMLEGTDGMDVAGTAWAFNQLLALPGCSQGVVSEQDMQQLLDKQRLLGPQQAVRLLTRQINSAETVVQLADVLDQWGGSFDYIHAAAALTKFAKLSRRGPEDNQLLQLLVQKWLQQLPEAGVRECSNVLWTCANPSTQQVDAVWDATWAAFMQHVAQGPGKGLVPQDISKALHAAAQLHKQPGAGELQLLLETFLQPDVLAAAHTQHIEDLTGALDQLQQQLSEQDLQQLLNKQRLLAENQAERELTRQISSAEAVAQLSDISDQ